MANYRLLLELGRGGMGVVHKALQVELRREVALKLLHPDLCKDERTLRRFQSEALTLGQLGHQHIVKIFDSGVLDGQPFIAMELIEGTDLWSMIEERGAFPLAEVMDLVAQAADALDCIHQNGKTHRDVKPSNMMVDARGHLTIMDFGLAKSVDNTTVSAPGELVGSLRYLAPECCTSTSSAPAADVYALGITILELLLGGPWVRTASAPRLIEDIVHGGARKRAMAVPDLAPWMVDLLSKALEVDAAERITAAAIKSSLRDQRSLQRRGRRSTPHSGGGLHNRHPYQQLVGVPALPAFRGWIRLALVGSGVLLASAYLGIESAKLHRQPLEATYSGPSTVPASLTVGPGAPVVSSIPWPQVPVPHHLTEKWRTFFPYRGRLRAAGSDAQHAVEELRHIAPFDMGRGREPWMAWLELSEWLSRTGTTPPPRSVLALNGEMEPYLALAMFAYVRNNQVSFSRETIPDAFISAVTYPDDGRTWLYLGAFIDLDGWVEGARRAYAIALRELKPEQMEKVPHEMWAFLIRALTVSSSPEDGLRKLAKEWLHWVGPAAARPEPWDELERWFASRAPEFYVSLLKHCREDSRALSSADKRIEEFEQRSRGIHSH